jgi:putative endonuclease
VAEGLLGVGSVSHRRVALGKTGEDLACAELERRGYAILARRFRCRGGEIDIIARDGTTLVFVEVKARESRAFGTAAEAVTQYKQHRIATIAAEYVMQHHLQNRPCRFDVVTIHFDGGQAAVEVFQNAFPGR